MANFWESDVWGFINLVSVLLVSLLAANLLKKSIRLLKVSLIPTSVLGGILLLLISVIYDAVTKNNIFNTDFFAGNGLANLEMITYHCLALGFIATTLKTTEKIKSKERTREIFNTGVTTVSTYLIQGVLGMAITLVTAFFVKDFFSSAGILLPFGYGQGTGQAMNYGGIYDNDYGFTGGKSFGLTIAAMGFLSASIGGVIHLNLLRKKGKVNTTEQEITDAINAEDIQSPDEIPMNGSIDKITVQIAMIFSSYSVAFVFMSILGAVIPSMKSTIFGFNFLLGVLSATLIKTILNALKNKKIVKKEYINPFLMNRLTGFFFDLMIVAGIAAIQLEFLKGYLAVLLILGFSGAFLTYAYVRFVCNKLFPRYNEEQFLAMYGMLTGTASTGIILLREIDKDFKTPASENLVFQNFPAIVFGFPMMLLASLAPKQPVLTFIILIVFFAIMNAILFRSFIFKKKK